MRQFWEKRGNTVVAYSRNADEGHRSLADLGKELATKGILVNAITPAAARTAMFDQMAQSHIDYMLSKIPMGRFLGVDEAAAMVAWLSSEECSFSTGAVFDLTGGRSTY